MAADKTKGKITQEDVARACNIDQGSVSRILNNDTRDSFAEDTVDKVFRIARELGYLHPTLVTSNRRDSIRKRGDLEAKIQIVIGTSTVWDEGVVTVEELSASGALLKNFQTKKRSFPADRFRCDIEIGGPKLKGFKARCKVVRFCDLEDAFGLGVKFEKLDDATKEKLTQYLK